MKTKDLFQKKFELTFDLKFLKKIHYLLRWV